MTHATPGVPDPDMLDDLVAANRILVDQGVMQAYGHVSARDLTNPGRYWLSRSSPPGFVTKEHILEFDLDSRPIRPDPPKLYEERAIHGEKHYGATATAQAFDLLRDRLDGCTHVLHQRDIP